VDAAYRSDLRELNELNFARFDARLEQRFAESALVFEQFARTLERQLAKLVLELKDQQVVQMRWMIGMWVVVLVAVIGLWIRS
jgi:hypothetical protein